MCILSSSRKDRSLLSFTFPFRLILREGSKLSASVNRVPEHIWLMETRELRVKYKLWGATSSRKGGEHSLGFPLPLPYSLRNIAIRMRIAHAIERIDECVCMRESDRERKGNKIIYLRKISAVKQDRHERIMSIGFRKKR